MAIKIKFNGSKAKLKRILFKSHKKNLNPLIKRKLMSWFLMKHCISTRTWRSFSGIKTRGRSYLNFRNNLWYKNPLAISKASLKDIMFPKIRQTIRNSYFNLKMISTFKKLVPYIDLPINFNLEPFKVLRYSARFYGYNYQPNFFNYNLWLTMGLKRNISLSFSLFFNTPTPRKNYLASFNKFSWKFYAYLLKNSLKPPLKFQLNNQLIANSTTNFYFNSNFSLHLSDICLWNLRPKFRFSRTINLGTDDLDFSISTYHYKFDYYNYRSRGQYFWISNNSNFRDTSCYITSYDPPLILSPRKYLKTLWLLKKFAKYHRSWYFLGKIKEFFNKSYFDCLTMINVIKNFFSNSFKKYITSYFLNDKRLKIFKSYLYSFFINKKYIRFILSAIPNIINSLTLTKFLYFGLISTSTNKNNLLYNKFFSSKHNNQNIASWINVKKYISNSKNLVKVKNLHRLFLKHISPFKNILFCKRWKFKFNKYYFRSHGFLKFKITRWKEYFKGFQTLRALGIKHSLQVTARYQPLRPYSDFFNLYQKRTKRIIKFMGMFSYKCFNFYFINVQQNWNLNTNFFNSNILENYNFQLYYLISYLLRMQKVLLIPQLIKKRYIMPLNRRFFKNFANKTRKWTITKVKINKVRYLKSSAKLKLLDSYIGSNIFSIAWSRKSLK